MRLLGNMTATHLDRSSSQPTFVAGIESSGHPVLGDENWSKAVIAHPLQKVACH